MNQSLTATMNLVRAAGTVSRRLDASLGGAHGLSLVEVMLLMHLERAPGARLRRVDLAERLGMSQSSVTRLLGPLERRGIVSRESDDRDSRVSYASLTASGERLAKDAEKTLGEISVTVFSDRWSDDDVALTGEMLGRLTAALPGALP